MKRVYKVISLIMICMFFSINAFASGTLRYPKEYYDRIAWTWEYQAPYDESYNCLGYALGMHTYVWPWGDNNPNISQVKIYLQGKGYTAFEDPSTGPKQLPAIMCYGWTYEVTHFSKGALGVGSDASIAKWGAMELMKSYSYDPYFETSYSYGKLLAKFKH